MPVYYHKPFGFCRPELADYFSQKDFRNCFIRNLLSKKVQIMGPLFFRRANPLLRYHYVTLYLTANSVWVCFIPPLAGQEDTRGLDSGSSPE
mgnify:CR=1 FL=1